MSQIWDSLESRTTRDHAPGSLKIDESELRRFAAAYPDILEDFDLKNLGAVERYKRDLILVPDTAAREMYFGSDHAAYWLSGLLDAEKVARRTKLDPGKSYQFLDLGAASGRVLRHLLPKFPNSKFWAADLKRSNVEWLRQGFQSGPVKVLHNSSLPYLPFESKSFDVIVAFSVFTHIDIHEEEWLMELRRLVADHGVIYLTLLTDRIWNSLGQLLVYNVTHSREAAQSFDGPMPSDRFVFHGVGDGPAYMETVVHRRSYIERNWSSFFSSLDWFPAGHHFQDVLILRK